MRRLVVRHGCPPDPLRLIVTAVSVGRHSATSRAGQDLCAGPGWRSRNEPSRPGVRPGPAYDHGMKLVERGPQLAALDQHLRTAAKRGGRLVVVGGEAGVGRPPSSARSRPSTRGGRAFSGVRRPLHAATARAAPRHGGRARARGRRPAGRGLRRHARGAPGTAHRRGVRGRPLGRRGDPRPAPVPRAAARLDRDAVDRDLPRRRARRSASASLPARGSRIGSTDLIAAVDRGSGSYACAGLRGRSRRAVSPERRESLLRDGSPCRRKWRRSGERARCGPRTRGAASRRGPRGARPGGRARSTGRARAARDAAGRPGGCSRALPRCRRSASA
jgi:hypothetical protein